MTALLALDTSSPVLSLALKDKKGKIHSGTVEGLMNHAERILPLMEQLFKKSRISLNDIEGFLIGRGPGSFTGLRVGFATLKGFLAGSEVPCYGALSLDLIAENKCFSKLSEGSNLAVALDAFREKIYLRVYTRKNGSWTSTKEPQVLSVEETLKSIPANAIVTGNALGKYGAAFKQSGLKMEEEENWFPQASSLIELFDRKDPKLEKIDRRKLLPFYFRLSEAEERKNVTAAC